MHVAILGANLPFNIHINDVYYILMWQKLISALPKVSLYHLRQTSRRQRTRRAKPILSLGQEQFCRIKEISFVGS